jgi:hypothetical protein
VWVLGQRRLAARAALELGLATVRYWVSVAPLVRTQLSHWERRAQSIAAPELRAIALSKLRAERFNAEAAAMLATRVKRSHRRHTVEAIVALELLFDLLDGLTELPLSDPLLDGERLFATFTSAVAAPASREATAATNDSGYLSELSAVVSRALSRLPGAATISPLARDVALRAAQAQIRMHAARRLGAGQLEQWARAQPKQTGLQWRELICGSASSVLVVHALIAAATDPNITRAQAERIAQTYLSICVLATLLDGLTDFEQDARTGEPGYLGLYRDRAELTRTMTGVARLAVRQARELPHSAHHQMMLAGVAGYYASAPGADSEFARPILAELNATLKPLISPTLVVMRLWRLARRLRHTERLSDHIAKECDYHASDAPGSGTTSPGAV